MKAIAKLQEQIEELSQDYQTTVIRADRSGIVIWMQDLEKEDILQKDQYLLEIADENTCYVALKDEGNVLSYGNQVTVTYRNREEEERTAQGVVANVNSLAVSRALQSEYTYILGQVRRGGPAAGDGTCAGGAQTRRAGDKRADLCECGGGGRKYCAPQFYRRRL